MNDPAAVILEGRRHRGWLRALHAFEENDTPAPAKMREALAEEPAKLRQLAARIEKMIQASELLTGSTGLKAKRSTGKKRNSKSGKAQ